MGKMDDSYFTMFDTIEDIDQDITCQRCGEEGLHWEVREGLPKLYNEDGDRHICQPDVKGFTAL